MRSSSMKSSSAATLLNMTLYPRLVWRGSRNPARIRRKYIGSTPRGKELFRFPGRIFLDGSFAHVYPRRAGSAQGAGVAAGTLQEPRPDRRTEAKGHQDPHQLPLQDRLPARADQPAPRGGELRAV